MLMPTVKLRFTHNYGCPVQYPACPTSRLFAEIARTKTLSADVVDCIRRLGYGITYVGDEPANVPAAPITQEGNS